MEKISGNFLTQPNRDFPLDCETLEYLQELARIAGLAGNLGGDRTILCGCAATDPEGTHRGAGWVFLRTQAHPEGEILPWEGGPASGGMYLRAEDVAVSADNTDYPKAYTRRSLAPGIGAENYRWEDFAEIKTVRELMAENAALRGEVARLQPPPLGIVQMWAGAAVPEGYVLCDGRQMKQSDWPELYRALGAAFNSAPDAGGTPYRTQAGYFRVPDLRGRFVVGLHDSDGEYASPGMAGGLKRVALTAEEMPAHTHGMVFRYPRWGGASNTRPFPDGDGGTFDRETGSAGGGKAHENRPPYYVLAYIMRGR